MTARIQMVSIAIVLCAAQVSASVVAEKAAVSSPETWSTSAGLRVMRAGGTAADAAVAVAFTLSVIRPGTVGVGGGGTALYFDAATGEVWALDFRPAVPNPAYLEGKPPENAPPLAVPGFVAGLGELHRKFGELKWKTLIEPAIALADGGIDTTDVISRIEEELLSRSIETPGWLNRETSRAEVPTEILTRIAAKGADEPYLGETSKRIIGRSRERGGLLTPRALAEYTPRWRSPVRVDFRGDQIYALPSPSGAGNALAEMVSVLSGFDWRGRTAGQARTVHLFVEAARAGWIANREVVAERGTVVRPETSGPERLLEIRESMERGPLDESIEGPMSRRNDMSGFVVVDERGNLAVVSLTLGPPFGSGVVVDGFFLAEAPSAGGSSSSLPLIVVQKGRARAGITVTGPERASLLGASVYLENRLLGTDLEEAVELPRFIPAPEARTVVCESGTSLDLIDALNVIGHGVEWGDRLGIVHIIDVRDSLVTISDPRGGTIGGY